MPARIRGFIYSALILISIIVLILHLSTLDFDVSNRTFDELAPVIYLPMMILFFIVLLILTIKRK